MATAFDTVQIDGLLYNLITPKLPVSHYQYNLFIPPGSDVRSVLPDGHVISSSHAGQCGSGWIDLPCLLQSVRQRHALTQAPRLVSHLRGWHDSHSHVPQADARQLPGVLPQWPTTVVERMEYRHKCFQKHCDDIRACPTALHPSPTSNTFRGTNPMGRNYSLSGVTLDKRLTWSSHNLQVRKKTAQMMGMLGPLV